MFDKHTILAFVIIGLILMLWGPYQKLVSPPPPPLESDQDMVSRQPADGSTPQPIAGQKSAPPLVVSQQALEPIIEVPSNSEKEARKVIVETDLYTAEISTLGGSITSWVLKEYDHKDGSVLDLIPENSQGNTALRFRTARADTFYGERHDMLIEGAGDEQSTIKVSFNREGVGKLRMKYAFTDERYYEKEFIFYKDDYLIDVSYRFVGCENVMDGREFTILWNSGLPSSETNLSDDVNYMKLYALMGQELLTVDAGDPQPLEVEVGNTSWIAIRNKYFTAAVMPEQMSTEIGYSGTPVTMNNVLTRKDYHVTLKYRLSDLDKSVLKSRIFIGPLKYGKILDLDVGLERIMDFGWKIIRPLAKLIHHTLTWLYKIIPNYGVVIIVFSILVKLLLSPLTAKSYKSMREMQLLGPKLKELQKKYKDKPQKLNKATMNLYKEHGVNPAGGCIPLLLQMPVFFALYPVFLSAIEFRNAPFIWWMTDLSSPDAIATLPFDIPMYGSQLNVLPIVMAFSQFIQSKLTMKDPKQKMMVYFMPVIMMFIFNSFASGLVLYWTFFNLFSTIQQYLFHGTSGKESEKDK